MKLRLEAMRIPDRTSIRRRLYLSCIAWSAVCLPLVLAGVRAVLLVPFVVVVGAIEYLTYRRSAIRKARAADAGLDRETEEAMRACSWFYASLEGFEASTFERLAAAFLAGHSVTGVSGVEVTPSMRALIASSAIMLVYGRHDWEYDGLGEILVYPGSFSDDGSFELTGDRGRRSVLGMAHHLGNVIISLPHLLGGPGAALAVHEFTHVIDGVRGADGIPSGLRGEELAGWKRTLDEAMTQGLPGDRPLPGDPPPSPVEFLASAAELFFLQPARLLRERPGLYAGMKEVFRLDPASCPRSPGYGEEPPVDTGDSPQAPSFRLRRREAPSRAFRGRGRRSSGLPGSRS